MIERILNIVTIAMFVATAVILGLFIWGGEVPDTQHYTPEYTSALLDWAYILCAIASIAAVIFPVIRLFTRPKEAMKSFIGIGVLAAVVLLAYLMADGTPLNIVGYTGPDNVPSMLIMSDTVLNTMYILFFGAIAAIAFSELYRKVR